MQPKTHSSAEATFVSLIVQRAEYGEKKKPQRLPLKAEACGVEIRRVPFKIPESLKPNETTHTVLRYYLSRGSNKWERFIIG